MERFHFQRPYSGPLQAVILDWAGTTLDYGSRAPVAALIRAFEQCGVAISVDQARGPMGKAKKEHIQALMELPDLASRWRELHNRKPSAQDIDLVYENFLPIQIKILPEYAALIPGCLETISFCRRHNIRIGSSTGYTAELMKIIMPLAREQGYEPDTMVCASDISPGRPAPWMCLENARRLNVYPPQACVKIDDTLVGIEAGLNAGMWTVGIARTGNLVGLTQAELEQLGREEQESMIAAAKDQLAQCGAHYVVDSIADVPPVLDDINERLRLG
ncbi:MAG: phosphonoacetaldehyde hydrolase [Bythopirellula sp.]|nr:phosphonoacetaldehyde hydrolase [Bythopirellula sp.]